MSQRHDQLPRRLTARSRLLVAMATAGVATWLVPAQNGIGARMTATWDVFAVVYLGLAWYVIVVSTPASTRAYAERQDPSHQATFVLVLLGAVISFFSAAVMLQGAPKLSSPAGSTLTALCLVSIGCSWLLTHTVYGLHYAHLYYGSGHRASGLNFPGDELPDDFDFIYFSLTVGMTFQVSDVTITRRLLRRVVIRHALLSFIYGTVIIATTINLIASRL